MRICTSLALAIAAVGFAASAVDAATITLQQRVDGYTGTSDAIVREDQPTVIQYAGTSGNQQLLAGSIGTSGKKAHSMLSYDLSGVIAAAGGQTITVESVTLTLTVIGKEGNAITPVNVSLYQYNYNFVQTASTWNNPSGTGTDTTAGGTIGTLLSTTVASANNIESTFTFGSSTDFVNAINAALTGSGTLNLLIDSSGVNESLLRFAGVRYPNNLNYAPILSITYSVAEVPEPATIGLMVMAAGTLLLRKKR